MSHQGKNLQPYHFKPGVSGNPKGRPKGWGLRDSIHAIMAKEFPGDHDKRTYLDLFALTLVEMAMKGHPQAIKEVCGRFEGAIPQHAIDADDKRGKPVIEVRWIDPEDEKPAVNGHSNGSVSKSLPPAE